MSIFDLALPLTYEVHHLSTGISAIVYDANGCGIDTHLYEEQAAKIVKACNAYEGLVATLQSIAKRAHYLAGDTDEDMKRDLYHCEMLAKSALQQAGAL